MSKYIVNRLLQGLLTIFLVTLSIFLMVHFLPGDPILMYINQSDINSINEEELQELRDEYGLNDSLIIQYVNWVKKILHGDFGRSIFYRKDVSELLAARLPVTIHLGLLSTIISSVFGMLIGLVAALKRGGKIDLVLTLAANLGVTVPIFWLGVVMIYIFGLNLHWLPIHGYTSPFEDFWLSTQQLIMPIICLSVFSLAAVSRQTRSSLLEIIQQDYIRTAWAKGLSERMVTIRHALKNGLIPVVTLMGAHVSHILGGSVLIETIFNIPGIGRLLVSAVLSLDYTIVQAVFLLMAMMVVVTNLLVDISYGWFDPRIRYD